MEPGFLAAQVALRESEPQPAALRMKVLGWHGHLGQGQEDRSFSNLNSVNSKEEESLKDLAKGLAHLLKKDMENAFPYSDCRKAAALVGIRPGDLIPDLDLYFSELAGYCSWGGRILKWPPEKIATVRGRISETFLERYPQYRALQSVISEAENPDLVRDLALHEEMRNTLITVLEQVQQTS